MRSDNRKLKREIDIGKEDLENERVLHRKSRKLARDLSIELEDAKLQAETAVSENRDVLEQLKECKENALKWKEDFEALKVVVDGKTAQINGLLDSLAKAQQTTSATN
ncbi:unnamed protein product [Caenorhabditis angaria]|uniref:Uncharacterized protein n=1 Tax=Caenorhabditis angaria TaxID=860376 RepID=A0A9P1IL81_9PELO|nr:unnamed protein product [Caenorhabditis angaria]CAI5447636.1 unnamed protein product [Caenorhabditis angaria]